MAIPSRRLPLTALRTFEAAARHLSFKNAAEELSVSATTVSNQIRQLEKDWDCRLFHRQTRAVALTDAGKSLANVLSKAFSDSREEAEQHMAATRKTVSIAVGPIFGSRWLGPRLAKFGRDHPDIDLVVHHGARISSAEQMATDIVVDWGIGEWTDIEATKLMETRYSPIASPKLIAQHGPISDPSTLTQHTLIHQHDRSEWRNWFELAGHPNQVFNYEIVVIDSNVVQRSVKDGQGVALGVFPFLDGDVADGVLVKLFDIDLLPTRAYHLLTRVGARKRKDIRAVCNWVEAEAAGVV